MIIIRDTCHTQDCRLHNRYLISLGANRDVANDDGHLPSDLIDPDFKDLVELFKGTRMD